MSDETNNPWWWLSFATEEKFLGVVIIRGSGFVPAIRNAHILGINPGGEVRGLELPPDVTIPDWAKKTLLDKDQATNLETLFHMQLGIVKRDADGAEAFDTLPSPPNIPE
jgi:hypothetical protein